MLYEFYEREQYLFQLVKDGDQEWSVAFIRGKLHELDYFKQLPLLILADIKDDKKRKEKEKGE